MSTLARARHILGERLRGVAPRWILLLGWLVLGLYAYPGYLTTESVDQLVDSRVGEFTDWSSPTMTGLWRLLGLVISGPFGMLALQSGLFLLGVYRLLARALPPRAAALVACSVLLFPPVLAPLAVIWRDSQMAAFLVAGTAAVLDRRRAVRIAGLGLLLLACAMRETAAVAALPIVVFAFVWRDGQPHWQRHALGLAAWLAIAGTAAWLNDALTDTVTQRQQVVLAGRDIVGTLRFAARTDDATLRAQLAGAPLAVSENLQPHARGLYTQRAEILDGPARLLDRPATPAARAALLQARTRLALAHPRAYLDQRLRQFVRVIGWSRTGPRGQVYTAFTETHDQRASAQHVARHSTVQQVLVSAVRALEPTVLFRPYLYLGLALLLLLLLAAVRRQREALLLLGSGLAYQLSLLFVATSAEYRSSHWMIACTTLAAVLLVAQGMARTRSPSA